MEVVNPSVGLTDKDDPLQVGACSLMVQTM